MNHRSMWVLFSIASALCAFIAFLDDTPSVSTPGECFLVFPGLTAANVYEISLTSGEFQVVLKREISGWRCVYLKAGRLMVEDFADEERVNQLVEELSILEPSAPPLLIADPEQNAWAGYGLGSLDKARGDSIRVEYGTIHTLYMGKYAEENAASPPMVYVRKDEEKYLLKVDARLYRWMCDVRNNPNFMRTRKCFHLIPEHSPDRLLWQNRKDKAVLCYERGKWLLNREHRADDRVCEHLLKTMREMRIFLFSTEAEVEPQDSLAFGPDSLLLGYETEEASEYVMIGPSHRIKVKVGTAIEDIPCSYAARVHFYKGEIKTEYSYWITSSLVDKVPREFADFRDRSVLPFSPMKAVRMIRRGSQEWVADYANRQWQVRFARRGYVKRQIMAYVLIPYFTIPRPGRLDYEEAQNFLKELELLEADAFSHGESMPLSESLTLEFGPTHDPPSVEILWSDVPARGDLYPTRVRGEKTIYLLDGSKMASLSRNYTDFYNRRAHAFNFSLVKELIIERPGRVYELHKEDGLWWIERPVRAPAEKEHLEEILRNCSWVRAERVLAEEDFKNQYGCSKSGYRLMVRTEGEEGYAPIERRIEVGNEGEGRCAIWISGFPFVYEVDIALKRSMEKELHYCGWLPQGQSLKDAEYIEIIRPSKKFVRKDGAWFSEECRRLPMAKAQKFEDLLGQIRIQEFLAFDLISEHQRVIPMTSIPLRFLLPNLHRFPTPYERLGMEKPLLTIHVVHPHHNTTLHLAREQDRFIGAFAGQMNLFILENAAVAILLQETE